MCVNFGNLCPRCTILVYGKFGESVIYSVILLTVKAWRGGRFLSIASRNDLKRDKCRSFKTDCYKSTCHVVVRVDSTV